MKVWGNLLETERLLFRELFASDAQDMFALDSDPEVVQYTGDKPLIHINQALQYIESVRQQYQEFGMGRMATIVKKTNELVGWAGLKYIKELNGRSDNYDLGYRFHKRHWHQGYATESARAFVRLGFDAMQLRRISASVDVRHLASARVLEKCGLRFTNTFMDEGDLCAWYEVSARPTPPGRVSDQA